MRSIGSLSGRAIWPFATEEVYPQQGVSIQHMIGIIAEHYNFVLNPDPAAQESVIEFRRGFLSANEHILPVTLIQVYTNGFLVEANDTEIADFILSDLIQLLREAIQLREPARDQGRKYVSQVAVEFEYSIDDLLKSTRGMLGLLTQTFVEAGYVSEPIGVYKYEFRVDTTQVPPASIQPSFIIERRDQTPFSENRYYSMAPLPVSDHVELLRKIEKLAAPTRKSS